MNIGDFREWLETWWASTDAHEMAKKNSHGALLAFFDLYDALAPAERELANDVIAEWVGSENERKRFDALAMVDQFRIETAAAAVERHEALLVGSADPKASYELAKVRRILSHLRGV